VFEVNAARGKVTVKGSSTIAMTRGAYEYLKNACNVQYTWSTGKITPPASFPDYSIPRTVAPYKHRLYYNVCAYGYTTAFWKWEEWQRELDWMALHGINMPVAMAGQEAIWQKIFKEMGMTDKEIKEYFNGPAFLPWQRMGNVNSHDGPLPQSYIDGAAELQKQLVQRMMQLGMNPVVPAFSGFVPKAYKRLYPDAKLLEVKGWANFPDSNQTYILPPGSSDFTNIGRRFIQEYQNAYGQVHYYLADLFNENEVPVSESRRHTELAEYGKSVYNAINSADPQGTWVMQGWLFYNSQNFWDSESVKSFLSLVPNDRMLIIDLANEMFHGWEKHNGFFGKPWMYSIIHNFGGNSQMIGNLPLYATDIASMLANPKRGNLTGFGISPEGVQNNEVVYELLTDLSWSSKPIDIKLWLKNYTKQRYGKEDDKLFYAWLELLESVYSVPNAFVSNVYQSRPRIHPSSNMIDHPSFDRAVSQFIASANSYMGNPLFKHDLVQLVVQFAGNKVDGLIKRGLELSHAGDTATMMQVFGKVREIMLMMDGLMYTLPEQRLETWIDNARSWGKHSAESNYYEADAKRQVTVWINSSNPTLFEYANKVWSGLIRDYYMPRWMNFAEGLKSGAKADLKTWEENWIRTPGIRSKAPITGDVLTYARSLYNLAGESHKKYIPQVTAKASYLGNNSAEIRFTALSSPDQLFTPIEVPTATKGRTLKPKKELTRNPAANKEKTVQIRYTTDGSNPLPTSNEAIGGIQVTFPCTVKASVFYENKPVGGATSLYLPASFGKQVVLNSRPSSKYPSNSGNTLNDGISGTMSFKDGNWLGFEGENLTATIDLGSVTGVSSLTVSYMENVNAWVFGPSAINIEYSTDGSKYNSLYSRDIPISDIYAPAQISRFTAAFPITEARYIKVSVFNQSDLPAGTKWTGQRVWLFVDEISVN
jgi:alpha-N-acetylglucosaminidase